MTRRGKVAIWILGGAALLLMLGVIGVRSVGHDAGRWHVDPLAAERSGKPNDALVLPPGRERGDIESPVFAMTPKALAQAFHEVALAAPRTALIAGGPDAPFATYVQRSAWIGWPDYISARAVEAEGGAALAVWSRARFGRSDLGVNRARVERWLERLSERAGR